MLDVDDLRSVNPTIRTEYNKRKNKWLSEHCERKYTPEYYELFNNLSPLAAAILGVLGVQSCTMSMSIAKNNNNATQQTEQKANSEVKNDSINLKF